MCDEKKEISCIVLLLIDNTVRNSTYSTLHLWFPHIMSHFTVCIRMHELSAHHIVKLVLVQPAHVLTTPAQAVWLARLQCLLLGGF